jgi:bacterioferritin
MTMTVASREQHTAANIQAPSLSSVQELRERARRSIDDGAVTQSYAADRQKVIALLNQALATELVCVLRYRHHYFISAGLPAEAIKKEFLEHAMEEQEHADQLAERIIQLGGDPDFNPRGLAERSHAEYGNGKSLVEYLHDDLIAERVAIEFYTEAIQYIGGSDPTTRRVLESILSVEEQHAEEISSMMTSVHHREK